MESVNIIQYLENKSIFVTGATGFLAKIFVEKVLRIQPNIKKLYLLVRADDAHSAMQRFLNEVVEKELFKVLRGKWGGNLHSFISEKVAVVPGDVSEDDLGVAYSHLKEEMLAETNVVLNFAASTKFDERYDVALETNTMGALHVLSFAKKCLNINMFLHVSTAYVCGERSEVIKEKPFYNGESLKKTCKLDITTEKKLVEEKIKQLREESASKETVTSIMKDLGIERARLRGWPNTYVFTKAMGEMSLCCNIENLPFVIIRPTMIVSTYKEPFPGWIEGLRTLDGVIIGYGKGKVKCLPANPDALLDLIPADMVVNATMMAMVAKADPHFSSSIIYHVGSSMSNPIKFSNIHEYIYRYFTKNPYREDGKAVQVSKGTIMNTDAEFQRYMAIRYVLPLKGLKLLNLVFCQHYKNICIKSDRKIKFLFRLVELYKPYLFFTGRFDDLNSAKLQREIRENGLENDGINFNFVPNVIDWEDYFINIHLPGLLKYAVIKN